MSIPSYQQALDDGHRTGAKNASGWSMQARRAADIARQFCLRPEAVYRWLTEQYRDNFLALPAICQIDASAITLAVLNGWSYAHTQEVLAGQEVLVTT